MSFIPKGGAACMRAFYRSLIISNLMILILLIWSGANGYSGHLIYETSSLFAPPLGGALWITSLSQNLHLGTRIFGLILGTISFLTILLPHLAYN